MCRYIQLDELKTKLDLSERVMQGKRSDQRTFGLELMGLTSGAGYVKSLDLKSTLTYTQLTSIDNN